MASAPTLLVTSVLHWQLELVTGPSLIYWKHASWGHLRLAYCQQSSSTSIAAWNLPRADVSKI